jgi:hypothetical protein
MRQVRSNAMVDIPGRVARELRTTLVEAAWIAVE